MRNLFKKSLACCLALALCLTAMVGLTVSAAEVAGTITVGEVTVEPGTAEAKVDITLSAAGLSEAILNVSTDAGTITAVTSDDVSATLATNGIKMALYTEGDSSVDSATATITVALADTQTEKEYTVNVSIATAASVDENLINAEPASGKISVKAAHVHVTGYTNNENGTHTTKCTADGCDGTFVAATSDCTYVDGVCSACGYVKPVTGPTVDANLKVAGAAVGFGTSSLQVNFRIRKNVIALYDKVELVIVPQKYDLTTLNLVAEPTEIVPELTLNGNFYTYAYTDIYLYELGLNIDYMLRAYDAEGNLVAISETSTTSAATYLKTTFASSSDAKFRTLIVDTLVVGDKAASNMSATYPDSDLAKATSIIEGFDTSEATPSVESYNTVNDFNAIDAAFGSTSSSAHQVRYSVSVAGKVPYIGFRVKGASTLDINKISYRVSYTQKYSTGEIPYDKTFDISNSDIKKAGAFVTFSFAEVGLQDGDKDLAVEIMYDGEKVCDLTYSIETYLGGMMADATVGELATAIIKLGASFRDYNGI